MNPSASTPPDEDPNSELNILRREVRQLQATVRDTALQVAAQQDDLIQLRHSLSAAESQLEQTALREQDLRSQLQLQAVKRQQIESTMDAAEALIQSLRDMILETTLHDHPNPVRNPPEQKWPDRTVPRAPHTRRKGSVDDVKLDLVLQRIEEPPVAQKSSISHPPHHHVTSHDPSQQALHDSDQPPAPPSLVPQPNGGLQTSVNLPTDSNWPEEGLTETTLEYRAEIPRMDEIDHSDDDVHEDSDEFEVELETLDGPEPVLGRPDPSGMSAAGNIVVPTMPVGHLDNDTKDANAVSSSSMPVLEHSDQAPVTPMHRGGMHGWARTPRSLTSLSSPRRMPGRQKRASSLLRSAFRPSSSVNHHSKPTIRSAGLDPGDVLPRAVASIVAKTVGAPPPVALPTSITTALSDAHSGEIFALAASEDGMWTASGGDDSVVRVYDRSGALYASVVDISRSVTALAMRADEKGAEASDVIIYAGGNDGIVRAIRRNERRKAKWGVAAMMHVHSQAVRRIIATDKTGMGTTPNMLLTCSTDKTIRMSDVEHGKRPFSVTAPTPVFDVDFFTGNCHAIGLMVSAHNDGGVRLWSGRDANALVGAAKVHSKGVISVSCLSDGQSVLSLGRDNAIRLSDIRMNVGVVRDMEQGAHCTSDWHRLTTNWRFVACGAGKEGLCIWNVGTGKIVRSITPKVQDPDADVLDMVIKKFRNPGPVVVPIWSASGRLVCAHRMRQITFWSN